MRELCCAVEDEDASLLKGEGGFLKTGRGQTWKRRLLWDGRWLERV